MSTLRVFLLSTGQCAVCGSIIRETKQERPGMETTHVDIYCGHCNVTARFPLSFVDCEIVADSKNG